MQGREAMVSEALGAAVQQLAEGHFLERWHVSACGAQSVVQSRRYAHREYRSLLVFELSVINISTSCNISVKPCVGRAGGMSQLAPSTWVVADPEQPADPSFPRRKAAAVATAQDLVPTTIPMSLSSSTKLFLCTVRTTLEQNVSNASAALTMAQADLARYHSAGASCCCWHCRRRNDGCASARASFLEG